MKMSFHCIFLFIETPDRCSVEAFNKLLIGYLPSLKLTDVIFVFLLNQNKYANNYQKVFNQYIQFQKSLQHSLNFTL
jgi:hypothetical protein